MYTTPPLRFSPVEVKMAAPLKQMQEIQEEACNQQVVIGEPKSVFSGSTSNGRGGRSCLLPFAATISNIANSNKTQMNMHARGGARHSLVERDMPIGPQALIGNHVWPDRGDDRPHCEITLR